MAAAVMYVTVNGADNKDGSDWAHAMDMAAFITDIEGAAEAGDIYYVAGGTYTMGEAIDMSSQDGSAAAPITIIGVDSGTTNEPPVVGDHSTGDNRPLFAMEANDFYMAEYWKIYNIRFTGSDNLGVLLDDFCVLFNCKTSHSGTYGLNLSGHYSIAVACEATGSTTAMTMGVYCKALGCYIHDATTGILTTNLATGMYHNVIDTCSSVGISVDSGDTGASIINNTIYNCAKGILGVDAKTCIIANNIIKCDVGGSQVGIEWTTKTWCNYIDFNCWDCDDVIQDDDVEIGYYGVTGDPGMNDPANGDFSVTQADTNVHDKAVDAGQFTGATV